MTQQIKTRFKTLFIITIALPALWLAVAASAAAATDADGDNDLFEDSRDAAADARAAFDGKTKSEPTIMRGRLVTVHFDKLTAANADQANMPANSLSLNLFPDAAFTARLDRVEFNSSGSQSWIGHLDGVGTSSVILVQKDGLLMGHITMPGAVYQIRFIGPGVHAIYQIDQSKFPPDESLSPPSPAPAPDSRSHHGSLAPQGDALPRPYAAPDDGSTIDVLVAYTPAAQTAAGGASSISALIDLAASVTNTAYASSGINQRIRIVHKMAESYTEVDFNTDLNNITNGMADVQAARNQYAADEVILLVSNPSSGLCGLGWQMDMGNNNTAFADHAFAAVDQSCAAGNFSFAHEMGHNMGAHHDRYVDTDTTPLFLYNYGYVNVSGGWRTIMAYNNKCADQGKYCARIGNFSNPNVSNSGAPTGIAAGNSNAADNATTLNNTAYTVANFRASSSATTTNYSGTYSMTGLTINLAQSSSTLSGTFTAGSVSGNLGGFVDSSNHAYVWAWYVSSAGSVVLAGNLSVSGSAATFDFGGGQGPGGVIGEILLTGMTKSTLSGSTSITPGSGTANYAGTYTTPGLTITLTQSGSALSGTFTAGSLSGNLGGFVDSSNRAYVWAWFDSASAGSGVLAGNLSVSGSQATFDFGGGRENPGGLIGEILLSGLTKA